jgi:hypothetical protein
MHIAYIDDSGDANCAIFSALLVPAVQWQSALASLISFRRELKKTDGIFVTKELHATSFVAGRGHVAPAVVPKGRRAQIFRDALDLYAKMPDVHLLNSIFPHGQKARAFERLLNRINVFARKNDSHAILICDEGDERSFTRLARRMKAYNYIPSSFGTWPGGLTARNIPTDRILEDPVFRSSHSSYFIQAVDFCAYALLRFEQPLASKTRYGFDQAYLRLTPIMVPQANRFDPKNLGIIRP